MKGGDEAAQRAQQDRLHALADAVTDQLEPSIVPYLHDLIEANEGVVALEMIRDLLLERGEPVTISSFSALQTLSFELGLDPTVLESLRPLAEG